MNDTPMPRPAAPTRTTTYVPARRIIRLALPDGWARALLAGVEAALLAWALTTLTALSTYASVAANPWMTKTRWEDALLLGTDILGLVLGAPLRIGELAYHATPTLIALILIVIVRALLIPSRHFPASSHWFAVPGFVITVLLIVAGSSYVRWWEAIPGALLIALLAAAWAWHHSASHPLTAWGVAEWIREGLRQGMWLFGTVALFAVLGLGVAIGMNIDHVRDIHALLLADSTLAHTLIVLAQLAYVPSAAAWVLSWWAGPGILVGVDTLHSPVSAPTAAIPAVPVLGALARSTPGYWTIFLPILLGAALGLYFGIRRRRATLGDQARVGAVALGIFGLTVALWLTSSVLHLGAERMAYLGPRPGSVLVAVLAEVGGAFFLAAFASHPRSREWAREQWRISLLPPGRSANADTVANSIGTTEVDPHIGSDSSKQTANERDEHEVSKAEREATTPAPSTPQSELAAVNTGETQTAEHLGDPVLRSEHTAASSEESGVKVHAPAPPIPVHNDYWLKGNVRASVEFPAEQAAHDTNPQAAHETSPHDEDPQRGSVEHP